MPNPRVRIPSSSSRSSKEIRRPVPRRQVIYILLIWPVQKRLARLVHRVRRWRRRRRSTSLFPRLGWLSTLLPTQRFVKSGEAHLLDFDHVCRRNTYPTVIPNSPVSCKNRSEETLAPHSSLIVLPRRTMSLKLSPLSDSVSAPNPSRTTPKSTLSYHRWSSKRSLTNLQPRMRRCRGISRRWRKRSRSGGMEARWTGANGL